MDFLNLNAVPAGTVTDVRTTVMCVLAAFVSSHLLAFVYVWTHRGLSYSQSFVQTLVMASVATSIMMLVIGNNMVWGIGMVGALALVRFRTNLRDPRDMIFVFAALVLGLASGTRAFAVVVAGTLLFSLIAFYVSKISFGLRSYFDALLRFTLMDRDSVTTAAAQECLASHCSKFSLTMLQQLAHGHATEHVYQVRFRRIDSREALLRDLENVNGLTNLSMMLEETRVEM